MKTSNGRDAMKRSALAGVVTLFVLTAGCQSKTKQYSLRGQVLAMNEAANELTVKHEDIPGFMPAMTMPYKVRNSAAVQEVQAGDLIAADLITANQGKDYWLEDIRILDESGRKTAKPAVTRHVLQVGESVPDLLLINQDGKHFSLSDFKGKAVLVTFIYTRCPMPTFCPRLSSQFSKIHEALAKTPGDYEKTHLLTISFDPEYDTPPRYCASTAWRISTTMPRGSRIGTLHPPIPPRCARSPTHSGWNISRKTTRFRTRWISSLSRPAELWPGIGLPNGRRPSWRRHFARQGSRLPPILRQAARVKR